MLATEMLEALGVDTSKSFSLIETGEELERGDEPSPTRSSVLVRLSHSHIRIGTFQRFLYLNEPRQHPQAARLFRPDLHAGDLARRRSGSCDCLSRRGLPAGRAHGRAMDGGRLRARRSQHRQHQHHRRKLRLRPLAFPARTTIPHSPPPISTRRASTPSAASPTRCCGIFIASRNACFRSRRRPALSRRWLRSSRPCTGSFRRRSLRRLGLQSKGVEQDGALAKAVWTFLHESKAPFEQTFFDWYGGALSAAAREAEPVSGDL